MAVRSAKTKTEKFPVLYRDFSLTRDDKGFVRGLDKDKRTIRVQFSSEAPVDRWFGVEILDHSKKSINMQRIKDGTAVLLEHDTAQRIGITEGGEITDGRTAEATVRFAKTPLGDQCMAEVEDGTLRSISVGYRVHKWQVDEDSDEHRAIDWTPLEVSFVGIPADPSCKALRSTTNTENEATIMLIRSATKNRAKAETPAAPHIPEEGEELTEEQQEENRRLEMDNEIREVFALAHRWDKQYAGCIDEANRLVKRGNKMLEDMRGWVMEAQRKSPPKEWSRAANTETQPALSLGESFVKTRAYQELHGKRGSHRTISCEIPDRIQFRTTFSATTEALTSIQKIPGVPGILEQQPLFIADLFGQGETTNLTVRYIQEDSFTNAATAVAEGAVKPEATLNVSEVDATVRKIAVYTKVTDEMMEDFTQMQSYINSRLGYMVQGLEDTHLLSGSGNTNQIKGVLNFTGIQTVSGAANPLDGLMKAIAYVRGANGAGFAEPTAIVVHPKDWMNMKLTKDDNNQYYGGGPFSGIYGAGMYSNVYNIWGLPAVVTTAISQGTALVGNFRTAAMIFRRKGLTIEATNSDQNDFLYNLMTIRAEERLALAVFQPNQFCTVTSIPAV